MSIHVHFPEFLIDRFVQGCSVNGIRFNPGGPGPHPAEAPSGAGHAHAHRAHEGQQCRRQGKILN